MALLFNDERVTKAVLYFLRETKVGEMVTIPPRGVEGEEEGVREYSEGARVEAVGEGGGAHHHGGRIPIRRVNCCINRSSAFVGHTRLWRSYELMVRPS